MKKKILAIIPCRSGSKGIMNKNIVNIFGKPLIYYSIFFAQKCNFIDKIIVSTDSLKYKKIASKYGVEVPFLRPKKISKDNSLDVDLFKHAVSWLKKNQKYQPDIIVHLRPTTPLRKIKILKNAIKIILNNKKIDSVRSLTSMSKSPYKAWFMEKNNFIKPILKKKSIYKELFNVPRQKLTKAYIQNATYDVFRSSLLKKNLISGNKVRGIITEDKFDIDNTDQLNELKKLKKVFKSFNSYIFS